VIIKYGSPSVLAWSLVQRNTRFDFYAIPTVPGNKDAMSEQLLKDVKIMRRNAKVALTRAAKALLHLIKSKRPGKEVQKAYETLINKHEEFTKLIEDDKEFEEQEARLEESQYMFTSLETDTKLYLESTKEVQKEFKD